MLDEDFVAHAHQPKGAAPGLDPLYGIGIRVTHESPAPLPEGDQPASVSRLRSATGLLSHAISLLRR